MATLKELRIRVQSLKNTRKITSAMKMVSASKLKKAKDAASRTQPYIDSLRGVVGKLANHLEHMQNPLLEKREVQHTRFIVLASDRGLCGGFNNNLLKFFSKQADACESSYDVAAVGKRVNDAVRKKAGALYKYYDDTAAHPDFLAAQTISSDAIADFLSHKTDRVVLVYNEFVSSLTQRPCAQQLLPYAKPVTEDREGKERQDVEYLFEPDREAILNELLPKQLSIQVFQALLDNAIGEHAARMTAMDNATNNANDFISSLTVQMNRARQASITTELIEIISGAEAL